MKVTADLHIHSRYSRATSSRLNPACLERWARIKGIDLLGTGDATHPRWLKELRESLDDAEEGFFTLKKNLRAGFESGPALLEGLPEPSPVQGGGKDPFPRFVLSAEISTIYKKGGKTRKVHHLVLLPDFTAAAAFNLKLERVGNLVSDGRPILGIDSGDLLAMLLEADDRALLIPAHIWTPWFSALGARSGFDSIEECYGDLTCRIPAVETGLSSNPPMNWALGALDAFAVISNSDAHSPDKLGREATVFGMELSYSGLCSALRGGGAGVLETIEFFPQEGKYHYDGHRNCGIWLSPAEAAAAGGICPVCGKALTRGVMGRVLELADRPVNEEERCPQNCAGTNRRPYRSLVPLREILTELLGCGGASKKVNAAYNSLIRAGGTELAILSNLSERELEGLKAPGLSGELLAGAVGRMRSGEVSINPGYDGEYGVIRVFPGGRAFAGKKEAGLFGLEGIPAPAGAPEQAAHGKELPKRAAPKAPAFRRSVPVIQAAVQAAAPPPFVPDRDQKRVIAHDGRRVLVVAGPGAGKTAVLAARAARLIKEGADPSSILAVSFTIKAAAELRERILASLGPAAGGIRVSTFHAFCAALLREEGKGLVPDFTILSEGEREKILRKICVANQPGRNSPGRLGEYIEERKRFLLLPGENSPPLGIDKILPLGEVPPPVPGLEALYKIYRERLKDAGLADYEDLIAGAVRLLASQEEILSRLRRRFRHIFIDEYQDINFSQYVLVRLLVPAAGRGEGQAPENEESPALWVIGDPNQAIYGFRGSDKRFIDRFAEDYPGAVRLELLRSFRCAEPILKAAGRLTGAGLVSAAGENGAVSLFRREYPSDKSEAEGIARTLAALLGGMSFFAMDSGDAGDGEGGAAPGDCAVLVRAAALTDTIVKALKDHGIPFELSGRSLWWEDAPVKDLLEFIKERGEKKTGPAGTSDPAGEITAAWEALITGGGLKGYRKEAPEGVAELARLAGLFGSIPALTDALACGAGIPDVKTAGVRVMTIHASKGLEFDYVFAAGLEEGILPFTLYDGDKKAAGMDEEKRLLYVAMTRARRGLWLSLARSRVFRGRRLSGQPSRFLSELEDLIPLEAEIRRLKKAGQPLLF
ncbi:MAG: UvrD-helicase domain-containing protein [Treponema sp.]|jgi:uncharacterized protein (TIGR00375 family)|nr:UvrD-helicase domain-containing protein [Treponema sp.]